MLLFFLILLAVGVIQGQDYIDYEDMFSHTKNVTYSGFTIQGDCGPNKSCVPYHKCQNTDGRGVFNIRGEFEKIECESLKICCDTHQIDQSELQTMVTHQECGQANPNGLGLKSVVTTNFTQFGEFPWMMALVRKETRGDGDMTIYLSGGTLIHPRVVLTSAHNVDSFRNATILARGGEWNTQSTEEILKHKERKVARIVSHPSFTRKNLHNDVALLFLEKPFDLEPHINIVCMPENNFLQDGCLATGWGKNEFGRAGVYQVFLKKVILPLIDHDECQSKLRMSRLGEDFELHDGFTCAGGQEDIDTCTGDGGGPLVCPIQGTSNRYALIGIVAWGIGCNREGYPGVYIDVTKYKSWILDELAEAKIDIESKSIG